MATQSSANQPLISAAVCTYNRCESLRETLASLRAQRLPSGATMEILVIDNNSHDQTPQVVKEAAQASRWPLRYVKEPNQGIAYARNRALLSAHGTCVAFIDDDAVAEPDWIASLARCLEETRADLIGGRILPHWLAPRPSWLSDDLLGPVTSLDFGPTRKRCTRELFLTTNCAVRRSSMTRYGMFDTTLGRRGERWVGGEDFELCQRWLHAGASVVYEPTAVVRHTVSPERLTPAFYRRWFQDIGYTQAHQFDGKWHHAWSIVPLWRWRELAAASLRYLRTRVLPSSEEAKLQTEFWWVYERSFVRERFDHWRGKEPCHFVKA